jgi:hypothetical protein
MVMFPEKAAIHADASTLLQSFAFDFRLRPLVLEANGSGGMRRRLY